MTREIYGILYYASLEGFPWIPKDEAIPLLLKDEDAIYLDVPMGAILKASNGKIHMFGSMSHIVAYDECEASTHGCGCCSRRLDWEAIALPEQYLQWIREKGQI